MLGGSSSINGLLYLRGQPEDFDHWRQLGNTGWSFDDVLPYFRRAEDQERGEDALHGVGGPLAVSDVCEPHPLCEAFIDVGAAGRLSAQRRLQRPTQEGAGYFQLTATNGRRWSTAVGYLQAGAPAAQSHGRDQRAGDAASCSRAGARSASNTGRAARRTPRTRAREVILAGGAFNSPQLLQLSGVGPADAAALRTAST